MKREGFAPTLTKIRVLGVGGGGINALNRMIQQRIPGVEFVAVNTDSLSLATSLACTKLLVGASVTRGLGTDGNVFLGEQAAYESADSLRRIVRDADLLFLTASMGGGTGSGVLPIIAEMAQELGVMTIAVVTQPFSFEGKERQRNAEAGIRRLRQFADTVLVIPNDGQLHLVNKGATLEEALHMADTVLVHAIQAMSDLVTSSGLINVDFADVLAVLQQPGQAVMTVGQAQGENRAQQAVQEALSFPLLDLSLAGARDLLVNISAGPDLTLGEIQQVVSSIQKATGSSASLKFGAVFDERLGQTLRVTIVAKGTCPALPVAETPDQQEASITSTTRPFPAVQLWQSLEPALGRLRHAFG